MTNWNNNGTSVFQTILFTENIYKYLQFFSIRKESQSSQIQSIWKTAAADCAFFGSPLWFPNSFFYFPSEKNDSDYNNFRTFPLSHIILRDPKYKNKHKKSPNLLLTVDVSAVKYFIIVSHVTSCIPQVFGLQMSSIFAVDRFFSFQNL